LHLQVSYGHGRTGVYHGAIGRGKWGSFSFILHINGIVIASAIHTDITLSRSFSFMCFYSCI